MNITLVGSGLIGGSWSIVFARAGYDVTLFDPSAAALETALNFIKTSAPALAGQGLLNGADPAAVVARVKTATSLAEAVRDADYIQESAPEKLPVKQALYQEMAPLVKADAVIASSTSGLKPSTFTADIAGRERCLVAHPINPPHLISLVEIVPAPWTAPAVVDKTQALMQSLGQTPVRLTREVDGFIVNRLQGAVLREAFCLLEDGLCDTAAIDAAMSEGLGPRWFFMGPFETIDLNAPGGIVDYCQRFGDMYNSFAQPVRPWTKEVVGEAERQRRLKMPFEQFEARKRWRDRCLAALVKAKRAMLKENA